MKDIGRTKLFSLFGLATLLTKVWAEQNERYFESEHRVDFLAILLLLHPAVGSVKRFYLGYV